MLASAASLLRRHARTSLLRLGPSSLCAATGGLPSLRALCVVPPPPLPAPSFDDVLSRLHAAAGTKSGKPTGGRPLPDAEECAAAVHGAVEAGTSPLPAVRLLCLPSSLVRWSPALADACLHAATVSRDGEAIVDVMRAVERERVVADLSLTSAAVVLLASEQRWAPVVDVFEKLVANGFDPPLAVAGRAVVAYANVGAYDTCVELLRQLVASDARRQLPPSVFYDALASLCVSNQGGAAFEVLTLAKTANVILPRGVYPDALAAVVPDVAKVEAVFDWLVQAGVLFKYPLRSRVLRTLLRGFPDTSPLQNLVRTVSKYSQRNPSDANRAAALLLSLHARSKNNKQVALVWETYLALDMKPSPANAAAVLDALITAHRPSEALAFFDRMASTGDGIIPDEYMLSWLLTACNQLGDYDRAQRLWSKYTAGSPPAVSPNTINYNIMMECAAVDHVEALRLLEEMQAKGVPVTEPTYAAAIRACGRAHLHELAFSLYDDMLMNGVSATGAVYRALLQVSITAKSLELARQCLDWMAAEGVKLKAPHTFSQLVKLALQADEPDAALAWTHACHGENPRHLGTADMFTAVAEYFSRKGDPEQTQATVEAAIGAGFPSSERLLRAVMAAHARSGDLDAAFKALEDYRKDGHAPTSASVKALIRACNTPETLPTGRKLLDEVMTNKPQTVGSYTAYTLACRDAKNAEGAVEVLHLLRKVRVPANARMFEAMLLTCVDCDRPDLAEFVLSAMSAAGMQLTEAAMAALHDKGMAATVGSV